MSNVSVSIVYFMCVIFAVIPGLIQAKKCDSFFRSFLKIIEYVSTYAFYFFLMCFFGEEKIVSIVNLIVELFLVVSLNYAIFALENTVFEYIRINNNENSFALKVIFSPVVFGVSCVAMIVFFIPNFSK